MSWTDLGIIFKVNQLSSWAVSHAYVPTAVELTDRIRVFVAFWDSKKYGRLGYIDVDPNNPENILGYSKDPIIEDAVSPAFDDSGVTPLSILKEEKRLLLYYAGWHLHPDPSIRYQLYTGLLFGTVAGEKFQRNSPRPVLSGRTPKENVRTGGHVLRTQEGYRAYLATQVDIYQDHAKSRPVYNLECAFSKDGILWGEKQKLILEHEKGQILGYGRSAIWKNKHHIYEGLFSVRNWDGRYRNILYSTSEDGLSWTPLSAGNKAFLSSMTCDQQEEVCFPSLIFKNDKIFMFYNGNDFGAAGLRLAVWHNRG